ncbi:hypothetical protein, partial [Xenorhabdus sp. Sc-CR9]|uniref:hypothetical protein n=1 Tax=Xenorhabdus sp. Sc-CR9 TaxID=2584468 RepID=UPI001F4866F7
ISSYHLLTLVLAFGVIVLIFGETIITAPFAACFLYQKDQHALVYWRVRCTKCFTLQTEMVTSEKSAIAAWNQRANNDDR